MKYRGCWLCGLVKAHKAFAGLHKDECRRCLFAVEKVRQKIRDEAHLARANDPLHVLKIRMRTQLAGRSNFYKRDIESVLGYSMSQLKAHLEEKFTDGMTWALFVRGRIHIDHVIPLLSVDCRDEETFKRLWSLENLQPLWATDNLKKSDKIPTSVPDWFDKVRKVKPGRP